MPSSIQIDKLSSFPSSSNDGKVLFGVNLNKDITITDNVGVTTIIGGSSSTLPYLEYVSKISRIGVNSPKTSHLLNNTLGINPIWTRISSGNFRFKFDGEIDIDKINSNVPIISGAGAFSYNITNELNLSNSFKLGFDSQVTSIAIQSDGKILVGGYFTTYNGTGSNRIIRLNSDGSIDNTFLSIDNGFDGSVSSIVIQSDEKIIVGGNFGSYNGTNSSHIIRLNSDGSIDTSFSIGGGFDNIVNTIAIQSDGKILVGGRFTSYNGTFSNYIIRLNSDGSIDTGFSIGGGFGGEDYGYVTSIKIQSDRKILVGGFFTSYNVTGSNRIIRLNLDGSIDTGFVIGSGLNSRALSFVTQSDGKILVGGVFTIYNGTSSNKIIRLNSDGSIDTSFSIGTGFDGDVFSIAIQSDGKILVGGEFTTYNETGSIYIIRLNSDGSIDTGFSVGTGFNNTVSSIVIQSDGKILVGGNFTTYNGTNSIIRLNSNGSYGFIGGFDGSVLYITIQSDGKILVGGGFTSYNGTTSNNIIRLNSDGSIDNTFSIGNGFNHVVSSIAIQSDGKILVGGNFTSYNVTGSNYIIRLNSDGSVDTTFSIGTGFDSEVYSIAIQSDGKILVGGDFSTYNGTNSNYIVRLNSDGSIDNTFSIGTGFDSIVNYIAIQSDGKILVGGNFTSYNGTGSNRIIRLNLDGSVDTGFLIGSGFNNYVTSIKIQSDGKILVGGVFTSYKGTTSNKIIRLNTDGGIDTGFSIGTGFGAKKRGADVNYITIQSDGKILVGGNFASYNGTNSAYIIRLNSDGSIQYSFDETLGQVSSIAIQSDGNVLVGGYFNTDNVNYFTKFDNEFFYNLNGDDTFENQPIEIKIYN